MNDPLFCTRPLLFEYDDDEVPYFGGGTCFVVKYNNAFYVLTARHCLKNISPDVIFVQNTRDSKESLPLSKIHTGIGDEYGDPPYSDLSIMVVANMKVSPAVAEQVECFHLSSLKPVPAEDLSNGRLIYRGFLKNPPAETGAGIDYDEKAIRWSPLQGEAKYAGLSGQDAIQKMELLALPQEVTDLDGLSGSPVFQLVKLPDGRALCRLVGMIVRASATGKVANFIDTTALYSALKQTVND